MIKPVHTAIIDRSRLRFLQPSTENRPFDLPWHSADDLMIIAGLDPDERKEFRRAFSDGLPDESRLIVANDGASTLIACDPSTLHGTLLNAAPPTTMEIPDHRHRPERPM